MTKYIIGEFFSSSEVTLYKNPSDQTVISHLDANNPAKSESSLLRRRHRKDISMTEYVQLKLRDLNKKPWEEILKSPLVRNYLLLIGLLLLALIVFFTYAVYKQYQHLRKNRVYSEIQY